ncbi:ABC-type transport system permease protein (probable substrate dipeptide/oligopeptide) (plasmid) [Natrialba magadii ATCC 43099]|uniref:ABC-type transport system permease protein (Probable substrate dipeptide/oligopeptide) n=1 Tax=Natrialba magadii (strain ATCC 43099 / DSM 3394 / CCM 3739 / CIP 104546 / IAM 13178 / JCM 8861 / NBRC 102185 / NCIMB 2190 / MS3) TaxID=547559 RepID=D3T0T8_NATMM|nr:ABC transporter permease [Natrialba magadii]ADD07197.1 ABC-type transport system permease protein (probable substrate dipeptide/oligopeptide) [Natrialba magadii ATCC 43099]ELY34311.1 binding-protein-dependent transport system inner membrane protein [Natrialba magadii ATCC 43099]
MGLLRYALRRFVQIIPVLFGIVTLMFVMMHALPGDPVRLYLGTEPGQELADDLIASYGFDRPLHEQYFDYLVRLGQGDLGQSFVYNRPVSDLIWERMEPTLVVMGLSYLVALPMAIGLGIYGAARHNEAGDHASRFAGLAGISTPNFWLALMLIYVVTYHLELLPASGYTSPFIDPVESLTLLIMPVITLATAQTALLMRMTRSSMIEELRADYIETARAYGIPERKVLIRHSFRNALLPLVTIVGLQVSTLLGGSVIVEEIFAIPGLGRLFFDSLIDQDYSVAVGVTLFFSTLFLIGVVLTDIAYAYIDPRIKYD